MTETDIRNDEQALPRNDEQALPTTEENTEKAVAAAWECPEFAISRVFSSHMVLQRDREIRIWGFSNWHGETVHGVLDTEAREAVVEDGGRWCLTFSARPASRTPIALTVTARDRVIALEDILMGDVWLIGGQSNADLRLSRCMEETPDLVFSEENGVRFFSQKSWIARGMPEKCAAPQPDVVDHETTWTRASREASLAHSALGWYFADVLTRYIDVPQGQIMMSSGGAAIFDLGPAEYAHAHGVFAGGMTCEGGLYNTLIHPFLGLSFAGQVFFQGESEGCSLIRSNTYDRLLTDFVADQRARFGFEFPFYNVQLSSYRDDGAAFFRHLHVVRMKQFDALRTIPRYTITPDFDLGALPKYEDWAHSTLKAELGRRVAMVVLADYYGIGDIDEANAPMPDRVSAQGDRLLVRFRGVGAGLVTYAGTPADSIGCEVTGWSVYDGETYTPASARLIAPDTVEVTCPPEVHPTHVAYAFIPTVTPENANLYRADMVPPPAFTEPIETI